MRELTLAIVGIDYPNRDGTNRRSELMFSELGETLELRPEPKNEFDEHAVAVFSARGAQIGYVTAERAPLIGARIRAGYPIRAILQGMDDKAGYARVTFDGLAPVLPNPVRVSESATKPRPQPQPDDDTGFYPDPDGPEWGA